MVVFKMEETPGDYANITEFDPKNIVDHATIICTARRRSGKSFSIQRFLYENRKRYDEIYFFSNTADVIPESEYFFIPKENRYSTLDEGVIRDLMEKQANILDYNKHVKKDKEKIKNNIVIILDDILTDSTFNNNRRENIVTKLFVEGRHICIGLYILVQSFSGREGVPPVLRKNADLIVSFYQHNINDRKNIAEQFLSIKGTKRGAALFEAVTNEAFQACVIDVNNTSAREYGDYVYKYTAPNKKLPKFKIPSDEKKKEPKLAALPVKKMKDNAMKAKPFVIRINVDTDPFSNVNIHEDFDATGRILNYAYDQ
jgi:hypothetical protein